MYIEDEFYYSDGNKKGYSKFNEEFGSINFRHFPI
jgi:hypothetical protein